MNTVHIQRTKVGSLLLNHSHNIHRKSHQVQTRNNSSNMSSNIINSRSIISSIRSRRRFHTKLDRKVHNASCNVITVASSTNTNRNTNDNSVVSNLVGLTLLISTAAAAAAATTTATTAMMMTLDNNHNHVNCEPNNSNSTSFATTQKSIATSTSNSTKGTTNQNQNQNQQTLFLDKNTKPSQEVDFIIIGYGNAGRSAEKILRLKCPNASILVVDPAPTMKNVSNDDVDDDNHDNGDLKERASLGFRKKKKKKKETIYIFGSAIGFDHTNQTVDIFQLQQQQLQSHNPSNNNKRNNEIMKRIKFKHSILLATGVRASPPPSSIIDTRAAERILEYRHTQLPPLNQFYNIHDIDAKNHNNNDNAYPTLPREAVRQIGLMAASSSHDSKVCILGSGIEAIELAAAMAEAQRNNNHNDTPTSISNNTATNKKKDKNNSNNKRSKNNNNISLVFGGPAPMHNILPRYLSTAVSKRLRANGIGVEDRSLVRYVLSVQGRGGGSVEVHLVKSFDDLDSKRCQADLLIVAPSVSGQQGTAVLPTITKAQNASSSPIPVLTFQPWSKMSEPSHILSCYSDDGRIVVNSELNAASNIYAAGSVAKYPNHMTGHATVAGEGIADGSLAGSIAAQNMAKEYQNREQQQQKQLYYVTGKNAVSNNSSGDSATTSYQSNTILFSQDKDLPILRTDKVSTSGENSTSLSSLGVRALCVGQCDSENMSTHGFWWTNQSLYNRRPTRRMSDFTSRRTSKDTVKEKGKVDKAVYGSGVVFYLDRSASIRGVMVWGLPFTTATENKKESQNGDLNKELIQRIEDIIRSNGKIMKKDHKNICEKINLDPTLLSQSHLAEESKYLATLAVNASPASNKKYSIPNLSNSHPIHRFVPSKPISVASMGVFKRGKAIGNGSAGDDIYERNVHESGSDEAGRHPSLVHYFSYDWRSSRPSPLDSSDVESDLEDGEDLDESNRIMSRPPKEETLWLRKNEATRHISLSEKMTDLFAYNLKQGQFYDGNDSVKQAPTPAFVNSAREEFEQWFDNDDMDGNSQSDTNQ